MRTIEDKILEAFGNGESRNLSVRDIVRCSDTEKVYELWGTALVVKTPEDTFINITGSGNVTGDFISPTTKSRLSCFLWRFGFGCLSQKNYVLYSGNQKLDYGWYRLDYTSKNLIPVKKVYNEYKFLEVKTPADE